MAVAQGFSKITTSGSVFMYDTADTVNSYKGEPSTNLALFSMNSGFSSDYPSNITFTDDSTVTYQGRQSKRVVATGQWNIYRYPRPSNYTATSSGQFTYSFKIKWADGHTPYFSNGYIYVDASTTYPGITVRAIDNGWFWCYCTYSGTSSPPWLTGFTTTDTGTCWITDWQLEAGLLHPTQYIAPGGTRSATQSLIPLISNNTLDLTNASFNSTGEISLDGSNDYIKASQNSNFYTNNWTWEMVVKFTANTGTYQGLVWAEGDTGEGSGLQYLLTLYSNAILHYRIYNTNSGWGYTDTANITFDPLKYNHITWQFNNGTTTIYINSVLFHTDTSRGAYSGGTNSPMFIGARNDGAYGAPMMPAVYRHYTRVLTPGEILNNYNHYKTKYNLS
jgi:hypothetical protein